jgi:selenium metabolism protein YedF
MAKIVDARGLVCPQPVILTRNALQEASDVTTIVDNETAQMNVTRMAKSSGAAVHAEKREDGIYLHISRITDAHEIPLPVLGKAVPVAGPLVLVIPSEFMGRGDDPELGSILMRGFFHALGEVEPSPDVIVFFNSGVKLVTEGSAIVEPLRALCDRGVKTLICRTCLARFGLEDKVTVGEISNMLAIAETMLQAGKVVSL